MRPSLRDSLAKAFAEASIAQKTVGALALLLIFGIVRWACIARITYDEGYMLDAIAHFPAKHVMQVVYNGRWGTRWVVTTGPTVSLPLGLLAYLFDLPVVLDRLVVTLTFSLLFTCAARLARLPLRVALSLTAFFLLWVLCMVWRPDNNGSSINLLANVFGEGTGFAFALVANLLAASEDPKRRRLTWICAALAVGSKSVALLGVACPCASLIVRAWRRRAPRELGLDGLGAALAVLLGWNLYLVGVLGWEEYVADWQGLTMWLGRGGGYNASHLFTFTWKVYQLVESHVSPWVLLLLTVLPAGLLGWLWRRGSLFSGRLLARAQTQMLLASIGLFYFWYVFFAGRGWMRHLWIGYALLGWLVSALLAQLLDKERRLWPLGAAFGLILTVVSVFHGTLPALGPLGPTERWSTQRQLAEALAEKYPYSRLMVADWRGVPHVAMFMRRPQNNFYEIQPEPGDLFLCDTESGCDDKIFGYCKPEMTIARVAYCQYLPEKK